MKKTLILAGLALAFVGCSSKETQTSFSLGETKAEVLAQLQTVNAKVITDTPECVKAEFKTPELKNPMLVEVTLRDGRVSNVNYVPQF